MVRANAQVLVSDIPDDIPAPGGGFVGRSGFDYGDVYLWYNEAADQLNVVVETFGMIGDSDGDGGSRSFGGPCQSITGASGVGEVPLADPDGVFSEFEAVSFEVDRDCSGGPTAYDLVIFIGQTAIPSGQLDQLWVAADQFSGQVGTIGGQGTVWQACARDVDNDVDCQLITAPGEAEPCEFEEREGAIVFQLNNWSSFFPGANLSPAIFNWRVDGGNGQDLPGEDEVLGSFDEARAQIECLKTVSDNELCDPGDTATVTLTFTNAGNTPLSNVLLEDILPAGLDWNGNFMDDPVNPIGAPTGTSPTVTWAPFVMLIGESRTVMFDVIANGCEGTITNTMTVEGTFEGDCAVIGALPCESSVDLSCIPPPDVACELIIRPEFICAGQPYQLTITARNTGPIAGDITIVGPGLPAKTITCENVPPGGTCEAVANLTAPDPCIGDVTHAYTVSIFEPLCERTVTADDPCEVTIPCREAPDVDCASVVGPDFVCAGLPYLVTVTAENTGPVNGDITITGPGLPAEGFTCTDVPPGGTCEAVANLVAPDPCVGSVTNAYTVEIYDPLCDVTVTADDPCELTIPCREAPDVDCVDVLGPQFVCSGAPYQVTVTATNSGPIPGDITITGDGLPAPGFTCSNVAPGGTCQTTVDLVAPNPCMGSVTNTYTVTIYDPECDVTVTADDPCEVTIPCREGPDAECTSVVGPDFLCAGDPYQVMVTATNTGPIPGDITITGPGLPAKMFTCTDVPPGGTCEAIANLVAPDPCIGDVTNAYVVTIYDPECDVTVTADDPCEVTIPCREAPDAECTTVMGPDFLCAGDPYQVIVTATNTGPIPGDITITGDGLPAGGFTCNDVPPGGTCQATADLVAPDPCIGDVTSTYTVTIYDPLCDVTVTADDPCEITIPCQEPPDVECTTVTGPDFLCAGDPYQVIVTATNTGPIPGDITITGDGLPAGGFTCTNVAPGATCQAVADLVAPDPCIGDVTSTYTVTIYDPLCDVTVTADDPCEITIPCQEPPEVICESVTANPPGPLSPGAPYQVTVVACNSGPIPGEIIVTGDGLPAGGISCGIVPVGGCCDPIVIDFVMPDPCPAGGVVTHTYNVSIYDPECDVTVPGLPCSVDVECVQGFACPRTPGFWARQACDSADWDPTRIKGQVKICRLAMRQLVRDVIDMTTVVGWQTRTGTTGEILTVDLPADNELLLQEICRQVDANLQIPSMTIRDQAERHLLALWMNVLGGAIGASEPVNLPGFTGTVGELIAFLEEQINLYRLGEPNQIQFAKDLADYVNNRVGIEERCPPEGENYVFHQLNVDAGCIPGAARRIDVVDMIRAGVVGNSTEAADLSGAPAIFESRVFPNPNVSGATSIFFTVTGDMGPSAVEVDVYDVSGRLVRSIQVGVRNPGEHTINWDLRNANGSQVSSGVYFFRLTVGREQHTLRQLVIRQ